MTGLAQNEKESKRLGSPYDVTLFFTIHNRISKTTLRQ